MPFGAPLEGVRTVGEVEAAIEEELARIDGWLAAGARDGAHDFELLVAPRRGSVEDAWPTRLLGALTGGGGRDG